jgi:tetratricopeptide (TPR) repeat protein
MSREKRLLYHIMNFVMEVNVCHQQGDYAGAQTWLDRGLALYPNDITLLNWEGVIRLELGEIEKARECFIKSTGIRLAWVGPVGRRW